MKEFKTIAEAIKEEISIEYMLKLSYMRKSWLESPKGNSQTITKAYAVEPTEESINVDIDMEVCENKENKGFDSIDQPMQATTEEDIGIEELKMVASQLNNQWILM